MATLFLPLASNALTAGPSAPTAATGWTNATNCLTENDTGATTNTNNDVIDVTDYDFAIPAGATINGFTVVYRGKTQGAGTDDIRLNLLGGGASPSPTTETTLDQTNSFANFTEGSGSALWGTTWTADAVNAVGFGVRVTADSNPSGTMHCDVASVTVDYTAAVVAGGDKTSEDDDFQTLQLGMDF